MLKHSYLGGVPGRHRVSTGYGSRVLRLALRDLLSDIASHQLPHSGTDQPELDEFVENQERRQVPAVAEPGDESHDLDGESDHDVNRDPDIDRIGTAVAPEHLDFAAGPSLGQLGSFEHDTP